jgi:hypothetical protein
MRNVSASAGLGLKGVIRKHARAPRAPRRIIGPIKFPAGGETCRASRCGALYTCNRVVSTRAVRVASKAKISLSCREGEGKGGEGGGAGSTREDGRCACADVSAWPRCYLTSLRSSLALSSRRLPRADFHNDVEPERVHARN